MKNKLRRILRNIAIRITEALAPIIETELCEGCDAPAEHWDGEGTPLCDDCWKELLEASGITQAQD